MRPHPTLGRVTGIEEKGGIDGNRLMQRQERRQDKRGAGGPSRPARGRKGQRFGGDADIDTAKYSLWKQKPVVAAQGHKIEAQGEGQDGQGGQEPGQA